jgi:multicomponent Na+:H+ antiporter subunit F
MIALAAAIGALLAAAFAVARLFGGPTLYDRVAAANAIALRIALAGAALAVLAGRQDFIDASIALVLALIVLNAAALKLFRTRNFQAPLARPDTRLDASAREV